MISQNFENYTEAREEDEAGEFSEEGVEAGAEVLERSTRHTRSFTGATHTKCV
jgi:hypothetical protein